MSTRRLSVLLACLALSPLASGSARAAAEARWRCVAFSEPGFPAIESEPLDASLLRSALTTCDLQTAGIDALARDDALRDVDLLVLPYGSAFPVEAWPVIRQHIRSGGNVLTIGGRPYSVPVRRGSSGFEVASPTNAYARELGIWHSYEAPRRAAARFVWDEDLAFLPAIDVRARRVFVTATLRGAGLFRGLGYLEAEDGTQTAAPVTRADRLDEDGVPGGGRGVFLSFDPEPGYWGSSDGKRLLRVAADHAARGAARLWLEMVSATLAPGEPPQVVAHLQRGPRAVARAPKGEVRVELVDGRKVRASRVVSCSGGECRETVAFAGALPPGLYTVRAAYLEGRETVEEYRTGFWSRDLRLLRGGPRLETDGDTFRLGGRPYLPMGVNYFSTDVFPTSFFVGGNPGGNAYRWDGDFAEMERLGITFVRTGTWLNQLDYQDKVTGGAEERYLRALEAFLHSAARHRMQVQFTFFAFNPQAVRQATGRPMLGPGQNAYLDPVSIRAERRYVQSIVSAFKDVPFLTWDLINEPNFADPGRLWSGNRPNGDPVELAAWRQWLRERYGTAEILAEAWGTTPEALGGDELGGVPIPGEDALDPRREGSIERMRAFDFNLFAQEGFVSWVRQLVDAVRQAGGRQLVAVGQDEGGISNRLLSQFLVDGGAAFTSSHPWWYDDALLWGSWAAKRADRPLLIGETGMQPVWNVDGTWRYDEVSASALVERKLALGLAAGGSGSLHWDWARGDVFGLKRSDGSAKVWLDALSGLARFATQAGPHAARRHPPDVAVVLPQSLQLSAMNGYAVGAQQACLRTLYHDARSAAYAVGEYQLGLLGEPRLILLPSPWVVSEAAWQTLLDKVRAGAVLAVTGPLDRDEHFRPVDRLSSLGLAGETVPLLSREVLLRGNDQEVALTFSGDKTTFLERARLGGDPYVVERPLGTGKVLYCPWPLELNDNRHAIARFYGLALAAAGVQPLYQTHEADLGILICPTRVAAGTLYVLTSESAEARTVEWRDVASDAHLRVRLGAGRAAAALILDDGRLAAQYGDVALPRD